MFQLNIWMFPVNDDKREQRAKFEFWRCWNAILRGLKTYSTLKFMRSTCGKSNDNAHQQNATVNETRRLVILVRDNYMASCPIIKAGIITFSFHCYFFHYLFSQAISVISFFLCYLSYASPPREFTFTPKKHFIAILTQTDWIKSIRSQSKAALSDFSDQIRP